MSGSQSEDAGFYVTDPTDPEAPVELASWQGLAPGSRVTVPGLGGTHIIAALYEFADTGDGGWVTAILDGGTYEVSARHLAQA